MVLSPAPIAKSTDDKPAARPLAYQQALAERDETKPSATKDGTSEKADIPPFETKTSPPPAAAQGAEDPAAIQDLPSDDTGDAPQDLASLPDESADGQDWPDDNTSQDLTAAPGADQPGTDDAEQWRDERDPPWAYGRPPPRDPYGPPQGDPYGPPDPYASQGDDPYGPPPGDPYGQDDAYGPPPARQYGDQQESAEWSDQNTEEWAQVILSGAAMRSTASEDAPMLFAFPYGRKLKVVSHYEGWVEVTDPKSAATGWMQAHMLAPSSTNQQQPYGQTEAYYDDEPRRRGGWFKRNGGGFADMINRALGGGN